MKNSIDFQKEIETYLNEKYKGKKLHLNRLPGQSAFDLAIDPNGYWLTIIKVSLVKVGYYEDKEIGIEFELENPDGGISLYFEDFICATFEIKP